MPKDPKDSGLPARRIPDELAHRHAHEAAGKAVEKIAIAYDSLFWDATAQQALAAVIMSGSDKKELADPKWSAIHAAEYADALLKERQRRAKK